MNVLFLVPDMLGPPGGIARHARLVADALAGGPGAVDVVALMDRCAPHPLPHPSGRGIRYQACGGRRAAFVARSFAAMQRRPDVVVVEHVHFAPLGWLLARLAGARFIAVAHGIEVWSPLSPTRRWALRAADQICCVSRFTAQRAAAANGLSPARLRVLPNCLDPRFDTVGSRTKVDGELALLTVARISRTEQYKGHDVVIRALPALLRRFPRLVYDVVGDGDGRPRLEALVQAEGVAHAVRFHGIVPEASLPDFYARAALFVMPSRGEGFGIAFLEAMAHGTPAVGGNQDATPEVIVDGETGSLVDPSSVDAVTRAIDRLLGDPAARKRMGARAAERARTQFSFPVFQARLWSYLDELQEHEPARPSHRRAEVRG